MALAPGSLGGWVGGECEPFPCGSWLTRLMTEALGVTQRARRAVVGEGEHVWKNREMILCRSKEGLVGACVRSLQEDPLAFIYLFILKRNFFFLYSDIRTRAYY